MLTVRHLTDPAVHSTIVEETYEKAAGRLVELLDIPVSKLGQENVAREAGFVERIDAIVLDIMHAMEYLWHAATALHGEKGKGRDRWVREHALVILEGREGRVIGALNARGN